MSVVSRVNFSITSSSLSDAFAAFSSSPAAIARAIAAGDEERAAKASDRLLNLIEKFTRSTVSP